MSAKANKPFLDLLKSFGIDCDHAMEIDIKIRGATPPVVSMTRVILTEGKAPEIVADEYKVIKIER